MKKILFLAVVAMLATMSVNGQDAYADLKHEVSVSTGLLPTSYVVDVLRLLGDAYETGITANYESTSHRGPYAIEYYYRVKEWLGVGGMFVYGNNNVRATEHDENTSISSLKASYFSLLPAAKLDWVRKQHFGMYSKFALGFTRRSEYVDFFDSSRGDEKRNVTHLNAQVTLLGLEAGGIHFRGFGELGFGEQGMILIGLRYKF